MKNTFFTTLTGLALLLGLSSCTYHETMKERNAETDRKIQELEREVERGKQLQR